MTDAKDELILKLAERLYICFEILQRRAERKSTKGIVDMKAADIVKQIDLFSFIPTTTALVVKGKPTFEQWLEAGKVLGKANKALMWWVGDWMNYGEKNYNDGRYEAAMEEFGFEYSTIQDAKYVSSHVTLSVRTDNLSFTHHKIVAALEATKQKRWLDKAERNEWTVSELRNEIRASQQKEFSVKHPLPSGVYRVIYADPPWKYSDELIEGYGAAEHHYPTMTIDELCKLPIRPLAADNSVLFLWVTTPLLDESMTIIDAWGFEYKTLFVWDKVKHNYGHYNSVRAELLLVCTRGSCLPDSGELHDSVISIERSDKHSEKPEYFRQMIDGLYTNGPRIELFARTKAKGWDTWGNEV